MRTLFSARCFALFLAATLTACGSGGGDGGSPAPVTPPPAPPASTAQQGVFIDAAVQGLGFTSRTFTGRTDANGRFDYRTGERVTFSLGRTPFGSVPGSDVVTPLTLAGTSDETDQRVTNIARLLQSLDADGNPENGIVLDQAVQDAADLFGPINFNQSTAAFALDPAVLGLLRAARGATATLVTTERALGHLRDATFRYRYPGIWRMTFTDGSGEFAIDNDGRVRGSAVYQGKTFALMGYVAGNGGVALYASDPTDPAMLRYAQTIFTVARFEGKLVDSGSASGTWALQQASGVSPAGAWSAVRAQPTFDLGIRADLALIIDRWHRTLPASWRYTIVTEERRAPTGELLSAWWLARMNACNQERIARGQPPSPLPSLDEVRVVDSWRFTGVYRLGRGVQRVVFPVIRPVLESCASRFTTAERQTWLSDTDDTVYSVPDTSVPPPFPPRSFVMSGLALPLIATLEYGMAGDPVLSGQTGLIDQQSCFWTPNADGRSEGGVMLQGRSCTLALDGLVTSYLVQVQPFRREREGNYDPTQPNTTSNTATTTVSISLQLDRTNPYGVRDDEVTPPVLRAR